MEKNKKTISASAVKIMEVIQGITSDIANIDGPSYLKNVGALTLMVNSLSVRNASDLLSGMRGYVDTLTEYEETFKDIKKHYEETGYTDVNVIPIPCNEAILKVMYRADGVDYNTLYIVDLTNGDMVIYSGGDDCTSILPIDVSTRLAEFIVSSYAVYNLIAPKCGEPNGVQ